MRFELFHALSVICTGGIVQHGDWAWRITCVRSAVEEVRVHVVQDILRSQYRSFHKVAFNLSDFACNSRIFQLIHRYWGVDFAMLTQIKHFTDRVVNRDQTQEFSTPAWLPNAFCGDVNQEALELIYHHFCYPNNKSSLQVNKMILNICTYMYFVKYVQPVSWTC